MRWPPTGARHLVKDSIMATSRHRPWPLVVVAGTLAGLAAVALVALRSPSAQAQSASLVSPPACTCSPPASIVGNELLNCTCGALQCVVAGKGAAVQPALVCIK
jgi:hypothetical protein